MNLIYIPEGKKRRYALISAILLALSLILFATSKFLPIPMVLTQLISLIFLIVALALFSRYVLIRYKYTLSSALAAAGADGAGAPCLAVFRINGNIDKEICTLALEGALFFDKKDEAIKKAKEEDITFRYDFTVTPKPDEFFYLIANYGTERVLCGFESSKDFTAAVREAIK